MIDEKDSSGNQKDGQASSPEADPKTTAQSAAAAPKLAATKTKTAKKKAPKKKPAKKGASQKTAKKVVGPRPFPAETLEEATRIPRLIREINGGNPWPPAEVARALDLAPKANRMWYLSASSRDYGLTTGTRDTDFIALDTLGHELVYAANAEVENAALQKAFFSIPVFKSVYEYYKGSTLPDLNYLRNTLESVFNLLPQYHEDFVKIYTENCRFLQNRGLTSTADNDARPALEKSNPHSIIVGEPKDKSARVAFVIMPFTEKTEKYPAGFFEEVLKNVITPAAVEAGFRVETAKREGSDVIHSTIVNDLLDADLVVADLTDHNPNVLFELGLRMASDKPVTLIRAKGTTPIFDVDNLLRVLDYDPNLWKSTLENDVPKMTNHIKGSWENRAATMTYMQILKRRD